MINLGGYILGRKDKLLERLLSRPADFTFAELTTVLGHLGYHLVNVGKTSGSRVAFTDGEGDYIRIHKPHPRNILKRYQIENIIAILAERNLL